MMVAYRFYELKRNPQLLPFITKEERAEFERELKGEARSQAAKRAVQTKRRIYTTWPTRKRDHVRKGPK